MTRRNIPRELRLDAAANLHRLESWRARTGYVRDLAARHGVEPRDTLGQNGWRLRLFGRDASSTGGPDAACSNWAQAVMREFPEAQP